MRGLLPTTSDSAILSTEWMATAGSFGALWPVVSDGFFGLSISYDKVFPVDPEDRGPPFSLYVEVPAHRALVQLDPFSYSLWRLTTAPLLEAWHRHGPAGGHVLKPGIGIKIFDFLDFLEIVFLHADDLFGKAAPWLCLQAVGLACRVFLAILLLLLCLLQHGSRISVCGISRARRGPLLLMTAFAMISTAGAVKTSASAPPFQRTRPPRPTDLELWASGQLTMAEQMSRAWTQVIHERPLGHSSGEAEAPSFTVPIEATMEDAAEVDGQRAVHVSAWVAAPYYVEEVVDIGVAFPQTRSTLARAILETCRGLPDSADEIVFTTPQLSDSHASCVAFPRWMRIINKFVMLIDCRGVGGTAFAFYHEGPVTRDSLLRHLPEDENDDISLFAFGRTNPLGDLHSLAPIQGGLIKALYHGEVCTWSDDIDLRLMWSIRAVKNSRCMEIISRKKSASCTWRSSSSAMSPTTVGFGFQMTRSPACRMQEDPSTGR